MVKIRPISNVIGFLLIIQGLLMLSCLGFSIHFDSGDSPALIKSGLITLVCGILLRMYRKGTTDISKREGYLIVALGWISMVAFGILPYLLSSTAPSFIDALFETASGFTTTGATIFDQMEALPEGILFWRSLTQWIGGMGIVVLTVAIFPLLGIGGIELFVAEVPGPTSDKIHPRIKGTARRLWLIYVVLTVLLIGTLKMLGMSLFDAMNHAFTTMSTGGFSTRTASMAYYSPTIQYVVVAFMFLAGTNFTITYFGLTGRLRRVWRSDEFRAYVLLVLSLIVILAVVLFTRGGYDAESSLRHAMFQIVSIVTTTGYVTADYSSWGLGVTTLLFVLFFCGACAGSTSGGIKIVRHMVFVRNSILEFKRILHPRAIVRIKINQEIVAPRILTHILVFLLLYLAIYVSGTIFVSACSVDFLTASGAVASSLANIGPGLGGVGPLNNYALLPDAAKVCLSFLMILGRLEIFTVLVLFTPYFWRTN